MTLDDLGRPKHSVRLKRSGTVIT